MITDILITITYIVLFFLAPALYFVLGISTFSKAFYRQSNHTEKTVYIIALLLPILATLVLFLTQRIHSSPCPNSFLPTLERSFLVMLYIFPLFFFVILTLWLRSRDNATKIIARSLIVFILGVITLFLILSTFGSQNVRAKGVDARRKGTLAGLRVELALYYNEHNDTYPIVRGLEVSARWQELKEILKKDIGSDPCYSKTSQPDYQYDYRNSQDGKKWIATVPLKTGGQWCVDSIGGAKVVNIDFDNSVLECPK